MQVLSPAFSCFRARFSGGSSGQIFPFGESQQGAITSAMSNMVAPARPASGTTTRRPTRRSDPTRHVPAMLKACPKSLGKVGKAKRAQCITVCCKCPRPDRHCERTVEGPALLLSVNVASAQYSSGVDTELISSPGQTPTGASTDVGLDSPHCPEPGHVCPRPVRDRPPPCSASMCCRSAISGRYGLHEQAMTVEALGPVRSSVAARGPESCPAQGKR